MTVPKNIQEKMHRIAKYASKVQELAKEVDEYFENQGFSIEMLRCGNGISLEELECGNDITEAFVREAENNFESDDWQEF